MVGQEESGGDVGKYKDETDYDGLEILNLKTDLDEIPLGNALDHMIEILLKLHERIKVLENKQQEKQHEHRNISKG